MSEPWQLWAACRDRHDEADKTFDHPLSAAAKKFVKDFCNGCPVRRECLEFALEVETTASRVGVFGGLTAKHRRYLARNGRRECSACSAPFIPPTKTVRRCRACRTGPLVDLSVPIVEHGTRAGAAAHWRRGEKACPSCSQARSAYDRAWKASRRGAA